MTDPDWLVVARKYVGVKEVPGIESSPVIVKWLQKLKSAWMEDATPWCGTFVAACFQETGYQLPQHWYRARAWLDWGVKVVVPTVGCVVIYERKGGGHVGFVVGKDHLGNLMTLGGNQGDQVSIAPFAMQRVLGYRWPTESVVRVAALPTFSSDGKVSTQES